MTDPVSGCLVTRGSGTALVVRTGPSTQLGKIQSTLVEAQTEEWERKTPLGESLDKFGTTLSYIIGAICLAVWLASVPRFTDSAFDTWIEGAVYYAKVGVALGGEFVCKSRFVLLVSRLTHCLLC